jgi:hypothetical protein
MVTLSGFAFDATVRGVRYTTDDLRTDMLLTGISVFSLGNGAFGLVFTGSGGSLGGSLELGFLSHEPTASISDRIGCCGGNGTVNRFKQLTPLVGDYSATAIPEPDTAALMAIGLLALERARALTRP